MFYGKSENNLDEKGRLSIPAKFKNKMDGKIYITISPSFEYLELITEGAHQRVQNFLATFNDFDSDANEMKLFINANTFEVELDKAGRINLPKEAMEIVHIKKQVIVTGNGDKLSIWDKAAFETKYNDNKPSMAKSMKDIAARLAQKSYDK